MIEDEHNYDGTKLRLIEDILKIEDRVLLAKLRAVILKDKFKDALPVEKSATLAELLEQSFKKTKPFSIQFGDEETLKVKSWKQVYVLSITRLVEAGIIKKTDCPVVDCYGKTKYCIHSEPVHSDGGRFHVAEQLNGLFIECHYNSETLIKNLDSIYHRFHVSIDDVTVWYK